MKINMLMLDYKRHKSLYNARGIIERIVNTVYRINFSGNKLINDGNILNNHLS